MNHNEGFYEFGEEILSGVEVMAGGVAAIAFGGWSILEGLSAAMKQDIFTLKPATVLAGVALLGYARARAAYSQLHSPLPDYIETFNTSPDDLI